MLGELAEEGSVNVAVGISDIEQVTCDTQNQNCMYMNIWDRGLAQAIFPCILSACYTI